ncbi:MAG: hypothetical protein HC880_09915 [Bacteroidia bacterium]|nr:hypothetical protein [Bacteroidia bacterium]
MITLVFYALLVWIGISALLMLLLRNVLYNAFCLLMVFLGVAALYVLAGADFLAITQIVVYVGGVLILLLFGIMLTKRAEGDHLDIRAALPLTAGVKNVFLGGFLAPEGYLCC